MKRHGGLWPEITSFPNLLHAARRAQRGKRFAESTARFNFRLEHEILRLQHELLSKTYRPGPYRTFMIWEPKPRLISAAPYRDRVVHHALCNVIEPIFDRTFIFDSYACRTGKGTHAAVDRLTYFMRRSRYALQCDVRKFFPSIDHEILKALIRRKIKCPDTVWLIDLILAHSNETVCSAGSSPYVRSAGPSPSLAPSPPAGRAGLGAAAWPPLHPPVDGGRKIRPEGRTTSAAVPPAEGLPLSYFPGDDLFTPAERRRGLPIGNLTSQFFANVYLNGFDHWMKETVGARHYLRYVDDFLVLGDDKEWLAGVLERTHDFQAGLRLRLHERKCRIFPAGCGTEFLGYQVFPDHRRLRQENLRRLRPRMERLQAEYAAGRIRVDGVRASVQSWIAHASHADTWGLRRAVLGRCAFVRGQAGKRRSGFAGRLVEQQSEQLSLCLPEQERAREPERQQRVPGGSFREDFAWPEFGRGIGRSAPG